MPGLKEITILPVENELHTCPDCGYERGFHSSFITTGMNKDNPVISPVEVFRVILICPECGARYDVGWQVSLNESESRFVKTPGHYRHLCTSRQPCCLSAPVPSP